MCSSFNAALNQNPELVNSNCYRKGWMTKPEIEENLDTSELLDFESHKALNRA